MISWPPGIESAGPCFRRSKPARAKQFSNPNVRFRRQHRCTPAIIRAVGRTASSTFGLNAEPIVTADHLSGLSLPVSSSMTVMHSCFGQNQMLRQRFRKRRSDPSAGPVTRMRSSLSPIHRLQGCTPVPKLSCDHHCNETFQSSGLDRHLLSSVCPATLNRSNWD